MGNKLFSNQNKPEQQQLIVTHHYVHRRVMFFSLLLFFISVIVPLVLNIVMVIVKNEMLRTIFSFVSILIISFNEIIKSSLNKIKYLAAQVQQKFDLGVFQFVNKFGYNDVSVEKEIERYKHKNWKRKRNIYQDYMMLDKNQAIFSCQRDNIDRIDTVTKRYKVLLVFIAFIVGIVFILSFIIDDITMSYAISILVNALPLFTYLVSGFSKMGTDDTFLTEIKDYSYKIRFLYQQSGKIDVKLLENLQWMLFYYRRTQISIPGWFDRLVYKKKVIIEDNKQEPKKVAKKTVKKVSPKKEKAVEVKKSAPKKAPAKKTPPKKVTKEASKTKT